MNVFSAANIRNALWVAVGMLVYTIAVKPMVDKVI